MTKVVIVSNFKQALVEAKKLGAVSFAGDIHYYNEASQLSGLDFTNKGGFVFIHRTVPAVHIRKVPGLVLTETQNGQNSR